MKNTYFIFIFLFIFASFNVMQAQEDNGSKNKKENVDTYDSRIDNMSYWLNLASEGVIPYNPAIPFKPAKFKSTKIKGGNGVKVADSPDIPVNNATDITESENSIFVNPMDADYVLNSNNSTSWNGSSVGSLYGANYFQTANGGTTWGGSKYGAGGNNSGDPTTAININGRQFVNYIAGSGGQGIAYSDNGSSWTTATVGPNPGSLADKNHMWIDNSPSSNYEGNLYVAWTDFGGSYDSEIVFSRCTNNGATWSSRINLSSGVNAGSHNQGVNIQTGPNGEVYVCWAIYDGWPTDETAIGFTKSTNGGVTFQTATRAIQNIKGIRTSEVSKNHRVNSFPSMAVDISGGANNGNIYIVWTNIGVPGSNSGTNRSVYMSKSTNGGASFSTAVRVNQGPFQNGKEAYFPWITCDPETGTLSVVFYDDRNTGSSQCETWVANSFDGGNTWDDFRVSDVAFTPSPISGLAGGYFGDYLGISARGGKVYPVWTDNRDAGRAMTYCSPFILDINAQFTADDNNICVGSSVNFTDNSSGPLPIISWQWSFPGGSPSSYSGQYPPAITYSSAGTYNVSLTVSDGANSSTETKTGYIVVENIIADFEGVPTMLVVGGTVNFTDLSDCNPTSWNWSFPGGTPSSFSGQNPPLITYNSEGTFNVSLTVSNGTYSDTETKSGYISVIPPEFNMQDGTVTTCMGNFYDPGGPSGDYSNNEDYTMTFYPNTPGAMLEFTFTMFNVENQSNCNYDYLRIYNGESPSSPLFGEYCGTSSPGTILASNAAGAITFVWHSDYSVTGPGWVATIECIGGGYPPVANFEADDTTPFIGQTVNFTDLTTNDPTSWSWLFDPSAITYVGGTNSSSQNPQVQFNTDGLYTVALTSTNAYGSDEEIKIDYIDVSDLPVPIADFTADDVNPDIGQVVNFTDLSANTPSSWLWSFTPNTVTYMGGTNSTSQNPQVQFDAEGFYTVTLMATNAYGSDEETKVDYIEVMGIVLPVADFEVSNANPDIGEVVTFTDLSSGLPDSWSWSFSPNTIDYRGATNSTSQNPHVQFNETGYYTVTLTATNANGSDDETKIDYILVAGIMAPIAEFEADDLMPNAGQTVNFTDLSTNVPTSWLWQIFPETYIFVGGTSSTSQNPQVQFNVQGFYTVSLTAANDYGSDYETKTDYIYAVGLLPPPVADFMADNTNPEIGETVNFTDLSTNIPTSWEWAFDPSTVIYVGGTSSTSQNPEVQFSSAGYYTVTLTATSGSGSDDEVKADYILVSEPSPYCDASGGGDEYISGVQLAEINNVGTGSDGYADYTSMFANVIVYETYEITVTNGNVWTDDDLGVWIDWNQDGDFYDADENIVCEVDDEGQGTFSFDVPAEAILGTTLMRVRIKYDGADCGDPCGTTAWGEVEDYSVIVNENSIAEIPPYFDDFESFNDGDYIAEELYFWTTWSNAPGTTEDAMITDVGTNALIVDAGTDAVLLLGDQTSGKYEVGFDMYIPSGHTGYFNLLQHFNGADSQWGMQVFFDLEGSGHGDANGTDAISFTYNYDEVMHIKSIVDLDNDEAQLFYNETLIYTWQWSEGAFGGNGLNQLGGLDIYGWDANGTPLTYYDNLYFVEIVDLDVKLFLEGAYNGVDMDPDLMSFLPQDQPYNTAPWNYNGTESVGTIPADVIDWILIEYRDALAPELATSSTIVHRQAAFLKSDGSIVNIDGTSMPEFRNFVYENLFFVVYHRNHIGIVSNNPLTLSSGMYMYDFSAGEDQVYGGVFAHKDLGGGNWGMAGGDADANGLIDMMDIDIWSVEAALNGYLKSDFDMNVEVDNKDKDDIWAPNEGMTTGIQTNFVEIKVQQAIPE